MKIPKVHDSLFRASMKDIQVAKGILKQYLPESIKHLLNWKTLKLCSTAFVSEQLEQSQSDIIYEAQLNTGQPLLFRFLLEHQSTVDELMPLRFLEYNLAMWFELKQKSPEKKLPLVIPILVFHSKKSYDGPQDIRKLIDAPQELIDRFLFKPFLLVDTTQIPDEQIRSELWSGLLLLTLKYALAKDHQKVKAMQDFFEMLDKLVEKLVAEGIHLQYPSILLNYCINTYDFPKEEFIRKVREIFNESRGVNAMTLAEQFAEYGKRVWRQEGLKEGLEKGRLEGLETGIEKGERLLFLHFLQAKFKEIPQDYREKINLLDVDTILALTEKLISVDSLEELFKK